jgi:hypothetical protein
MLFAASDYDIRNAMGLRICTVPTYAVYMYAPDWTARC